MSMYKINPSEIEEVSWHGVQIDYSIISEISEMKAYCEMIKSAFEDLESYQGKRASEVRSTPVEMNEYEKLYYSKKSKETYDAWDIETLNTSYRDAASQIIDEIANIATILSSELNIKTKKLESAADTLESLMNEQHHELKEAEQEVLEGLIFAEGSDLWKTAAEDGISAKDGNPDNDTGLTKENWEKYYKSQELRLRKGTGAEEGSYCIEKKVGDEWVGMKWLPGETISATYEKYMSQDSQSGSGDSNSSKSSSTEPKDIFEEKKSVREYDELAELLKERGITTKGIKKWIYNSKTKSWEIEYEPSRYTNFAGLETGLEKLTISEDGKILNAKFNPTLNSSKLVEVNPKTKSKSIEYTYSDGTIKENFGGRDGRREGYWGTIATYPKGREDHLIAAKNTLAPSSSSNSDVTTLAYDEGNGIIRLEHYKGTGAVVLETGTITKNAEKISETRVSSSTWGRVPTGMGARGTVRIDDNQLHFF